MNYAAIANEMGKLAFKPLLAAKKAELTTEQCDEVAQFVIGHLRIVRGLSLETISKYGQHMVGYLAWCNLHHVQALDATPMDIENWQSSLYTVKRFSAVWRRNALAGVRAWYNWKISIGVLKYSPAALIRPPKITKRVPRKYSLDALQKIFNFLSISKNPNQCRDRALLAVIYATGARREEAARLRLEDVEITPKTATIRFFGKGSKEREVRCEGVVVDILREWLVYRDKLLNEHNAMLSQIFISIQNDVIKAMSLESVRQVITRACKAAKVRDYGIHALRVTFATDLFDQNIDLEVIRIMMGHESIETTRGYVVVSERKRRAHMPAQHLAQVMGGLANVPEWAKRKIIDAS